MLFDFTAAPIVISHFFYRKILLTKLARFNIIINIMARFCSCYHFSLPPFNRYFHLLFIQLTCSLVHFPLFILFYMTPTKLQTTTFFLFVLYFLFFWGFYQGMEEHEQKEKENNKNETGWEVKPGATKDTENKKMYVKLKEGKWCWWRATKAKAKQNKVSRVEGRPTHTHTHTQEEEKLFFSVWNITLICF